MIPPQKTFPYTAFALVDDERPIPVTIVEQRRSLFGTFTYQVAADGRMLRREWLYPSAEAALEEVITHLSTELERSAGIVRQQRQSLNKAKTRLKLHLLAKRS